MIMRKVGYCPQFGFVNHLILLNPMLHSLGELNGLVGRSNL